MAAGRISTPGWWYVRMHVSARRHSRETHEVMQTRDPTFDSHLEMPVRDPSTVLHVQVLDTGFSGKT
eukprot:scaffold434_cov186-Pinguiococcus_pyrenoidosus.AAC.35